MKEKQVKIAAKQGAKGQPRKPSPSARGWSLPLTAINDLYQKRAELADDIEGHKRECTWLEGVLEHIDQLLLQFGSADPLTARVSGSRYLTYGEMRHRCLAAMRDGNTITAEVVIVQLMRQKCLDPLQHRQLRCDFIRRALRALATLRDEGRVEKIGYGRGVQWRLVETASAEVSPG